MPSWSTHRRRRKLRAKSDGLRLPSGGTSCVEVELLATRMAIEAWRSQHQLYSKRGRREKHKNRYHRHWTDPSSASPDWQVTTTATSNFSYIQSHRSTRTTISSPSHRIKMKLSATLALITLAAAAPLRRHDVYLPGGIGPDGLSKRAIGPGTAAVLGGVVSGIVAPAVTRWATKALGPAKRQEQQVDLAWDEVGSSRTSDRDVAL